MRHRGPTPPGIAQSIKDIATNGVPQSIRVALRAAEQLLERLWCNQPGVPRQDPHEFCFGTSNSIARTISLNVAFGSGRVNNPPNPSVKSAQRIPPFNIINRCDLNHARSTIKGPAG